MIRKNVFDDILLIEHVAFLVERDDLLSKRFPRVGKINLLAAQKDTPAVPLVRAGDDFHQRRLPRAILTDQSMDLAADTLEIYPSPAVTPGNLFTIPLQRNSTLCSSLISV